MQFQNVSLASIGYLAPSIRKTSADIEDELGPLYQRLRLPEGRLELMSGIKERRLFRSDERLSDLGAESCRLALESSGVHAEQVGCLIHASVCREFLEPATACRVHSLVGLPSRCWIYDVSNACLGVLNGMVQVATLIESGQIDAGLVVGTESASGLLAATVAQLLSDTTLTRQSIKSAFASLTIGSGSCAMLLVNSKKFDNHNLIQTAVARAHTQHHALCQSDTDSAGGGMMPTMQTDSEQLLHAGIETGRQTFEDFLSESKLSRSDFDGTVCHQVGSAHRKMMLSELNLNEASDFATFPIFGNTGSVALPTALAVGLHSTRIAQPSHLALLGIGSGINSVMLGLQANDVQVSGELQQLDLTLL
jgi:3-oxoacyl-[acyl-carrier-protein] synthase-3